MKFLDNITKETIVITPSYLKKEILQYFNTLNKLVNVKFYSLEEINKNLNYTYDEDSILYLMNKYNYSYENSKMYLDNMYYVEVKKYNIPKLDLLVGLKKELEKEKKLYYKPIFKEYINNKDIIIYGYDYLNKYYLKLLSDYKYTYIEKETFNKLLPIYKFNKLEDEVLFLVHEVINLINKGVSLNNIYLLNIDLNYEIEVKRIFKYFNIPVDINTSTCISSTIIGNTFLKLIFNNSIEKSIEILSKKINLSIISNQLLFNKIIEICNKYINLEYDLSIKIDAIKRDFKNTKIDNNNFVNILNISVINNNIFSDDDYVFILGFNEGIVPKTYMDEDYLNDELKKILGLDLTNELNEKEQISLVKNLKSIKNIVVSYKLRYKEKEYYPSSLITSDLFIEKLPIKEDVSYSNINSSLYLSSMLDDFIKYDYKNPNLDLYYNSFNIRYLDYDNRYKGINKDYLKNYLKGKLSLSYSTIDNFFRCQYRYFISSILKLEKYEDTMYTYIGDLFHILLSKCFDGNFDLDFEISSYIFNKNLKGKEKFYLEKIKKEFLIVYSFLQEFENITTFKDRLLEEEISIDKSQDDLNIRFKGIIDKIMFKKENDSTLVSIIDYKTGSIDINLDYVKHGIGMQLLIYLYLVSKSSKFYNPKFVGFYLQYILQNEINIDTVKDYLEEKKNNLKLKGYSINDQDLLREFDPSYEKSKYISGMKIKNDGEFYHYSKTMEKEEMEQYVSLVDQKIDFAINSILNADFSINPKMIKRENVGCIYCKYKDICFVTNNDIVVIEGDNNDD